MARPSHPKQVVGWDPSIHVGGGRTFAYAGQVLQAKHKNHWKKRVGGTRGFGRFGE